MSDCSYTVKMKATQAPLWKHRRPLLDRLDIELTERCNNNCIHCYTNLPPDDATAMNKELSADEIKAILEEAAALGCLTVRFTGGEPLLREDFEELYLFARRQGLTVILFTNATLITPELADLFAQVPPLQKIEVTLYGMKSRSYEAVSRTPGSFDAAWAGVNRLLERKIPFVVKSALLPPNKHEMKELERWAATIPWMDRPPSYVLFLDPHKTDRRKSETITKLRVSPSEGLAVLTQRSKEYTEQMKEFCSRFVSVPGDTLFSCGAGVRGCCLDAYGTLQPCQALRSPTTAYDLKKGSLRDALSRFFPEVRQIRARDADYLSRCAKCFLRSLCMQCPAKSWSEHGTLDRPVEYLCEVTHSQARHLGLLDEGVKAWESKDWEERTRSFCGTGPTADAGDRTC